MTSFERLSEIAHRMTDVIRAMDRHDLRTGDLPIDAAAICMKLCAPGVIPQGPELNCAGVAVAMYPDRLVAHEVRADVADLVHATDVHSLPDEPPRLLRRGCIVEVAHPERGERLFGNTVSLGCYEHKDRRAMVGLSYPDGARVSWWTPRWAGGDVKSGTAVDLDDPVVTIPLEAHAEHRTWAREAARFLVVFGMLLDAAGAPVRVEDESGRPRPQGKPKKGAKPPPAWVTRRVHLTTGAPVRGPAERDLSAAVAADLAGKTAVETRVTGHLKRQPYGPGGSQRRIIYVAEHAARRWTVVKPLRVVVSR